MFLIKGKPAGPTHLCRIVVIQPHWRVFEYEPPFQGHSTSIRFTYELWLSHSKVFILFYLSCLEVDLLVCFGSSALQLVVVNRWPDILLQDPRNWILFILTLHLQTERSQLLCFLFASEFPWIAPWCVVFEDLLVYSTLSDRSCLSDWFSTGLAVIGPGYDYGKIVYFLLINANILCLLCALPCGEYKENNCVVYIVSSS